MGLGHQLATLVLGETSGNQQYGIGLVEAGLIELVFVDDEVLVKLGEPYLGQIGIAEIVIVASEEVDISEDAFFRRNPLTIV